MIDSIGTERPSLYGTFRHRTYNQIYETFESFNDDFTLFKQNGLNPQLLNPITAQTIFMLLTAYYGNSVIINDSESQFKAKLFSIIYMYAPAWEKRVDVQNKLRNLTEQELTTGSKVIYNHAYNPGTKPSTTDLTELPEINEQNTNNYIKNKIEGYSNLIMLLKTDVTKEFVDKFKTLFMTIVEPELPLLYITEYGEEDSDD